MAETTYRTLRLFRILLLGAFVISLGAATAWKDDATGLGTVIRYLPPVLLLLALIVGLVERLYRTKHGIPPQRFGRA
jgi:hypothetical protein